MRGVAKGVYPVNTGKVSIGCMYLPKRVQYCTEAELFWQGILLRKPTPPSGVFLLVRHLSHFVRSVFRRVK